MIKQSKTFADRIYYGGNIGLSLGSYTIIGVYPLVDYNISPKLSMGVKVAYDYISDKRYTSNHSTSNYGGSIFARYRVIQPLYLHFEYAGLNYELYNIDGKSTREWIPFLFAGAGYSQRMGSNVWINAQILFDVFKVTILLIEIGNHFIVLVLVLDFSTTILHQSGLN